MESGKVIRLNQGNESYSRTTKKLTQSSPSPAIHFFLFHVFLFPERVPAAKSNGKHNITGSVTTNVFEGTQLAPIQLKGHSQVQRQMECIFLKRIDIEYFYAITPDVASAPTIYSSQWSFEEQILLRPSHFHLPCELKVKLRKILKPTACMDVSVHAHF